jgi:hypothetical protein
VAVAAFAAFGAAYVTNFGGFRDFIEGPVTDAINGLIGIWTNVSTLISDAWTYWQPSLDAIGNWFATNPVTQTLTDWGQLAANFEAALARIQGGLAALSGAADNVGAIGEMVGSGQVGVGDVIGAALNAIGAEIAPRAGGGPVAQGDAYLVGERGPELFVPRSSGTIMPSTQSGGVTVNIAAINANTRDDAQAIASEIDRVLRNTLGGNR